MWISFRGEIYIGIDVCFTYDIHTVYQQMTEHNDGYMYFTDISVHIYAN